jgi:uncharacterized protein YecT (DUF1311 family)
MKKKFGVFMAVALVLLFAASAFALSDAEYLKMKKNSPAFARADKALGQAWKEVQKVLSKSDFNRLKNEQKKWIAKGRDDEAEAFMDDGMSRVEAYTAATEHRVVALREIVDEAKKNKKPASRRFKLSYEDAEGYFDCTKKGKTVYLKIEGTGYEDELNASFSYGKDGDWEAPGALKGNVLTVSDGEDYTVTLTFKDIDTVEVKAGKLVRQDIGTVLDGTYKRHYGK